MPELHDPELALETLGSQSGDIGEVVASLMHEFQGPEGLARATKMVFDSAPEGGATQARIIVALLTLLQRHQATDDPDDDAQSMAAIERQLQAAGES